MKSGVTAANPRVPRPVKRELRRAALLNQMRGVGVQVCVLMAPSGFGKTTLLAQYARQFRGVVAWVALDEDVYGVQDIGRAVVEAVQAVVPDFSATHWTAANAEGYGAMRQAGGLAADINALSGAVCLVLDQGHLLNESTYAWLQRLIARLDSRIQVLLACYALPGAEVFHLGQLESSLILTEEDLAFAPDERKAFLNRKGVKPVEASHGYPIALAMQSFGSFDLRVTHVFGTKFKSLHSDAQRALLELACFPTWDRALIEDARFAVDETLLESLISKGFPLRRINGGVVPHKLFLEFLQGVVQGLPEAERNSTYVKTGEVLLARGSLFEALKCYQLAMDEETTHALLEQFVMQRFGEADYHSVMQAFALFSVENLPLRFQVCHAQALLETGRASEGVQRHRALYKSHRDDPLVAFAYSLVQQRLACYEEALESLSHLDSDRFDDSLKCRIILSRGESLLALGRWLEAENLLEEALSLSKSVGYVHGAWNAEMLAVARARTGHLQESASFFLEALEVYRSFHVYPRTVNWFLRIFENIQFKSEMGNLSDYLERMLEAYEEPDILRAQILHLLELHQPDPTRRAELKSLEEKLCIRFEMIVPAHITDAAPFAPIFEIFERVFPKRSRLMIVEGHQLEVFVDDQRFAPSLKKSFELMLYLAFFSGATQKQILSDVFSTKTATASSNFKIALSRLRSDARQFGLPGDFVLYEAGTYRISQTVEITRAACTNPNETLRFVQATFDSDWINERYLAQI
jgi:tetratricopeptide (TPR) repeat protein